MVLLYFWIKRRLSLRSQLVFSGFVMLEHIP